MAFSALSSTMISDDQTKQSCKIHCFRKFSVLVLRFAFVQFPTYKTAYMQLFMGLFVTGGFLFLFGQRVPSFDSSIIH
jgi:hypothetical protein